MEELLQALEKHIHTVARQLSDLQQLNEKLEQKKQSLLQENNELHKKNATAIQHIENMVTHLKLIEGLS